MFFKDENGIEVCQLGIGDVLVSETELKGVPAKECVGVVFGDIKEGEIDRHLPEFKGKMDYEAGVKFKLLFTNEQNED